MILRWFRERARRNRARQREIDVRVLWPELWRRTGGEPWRFIQAATLHTAVDPAWRRSEEWNDTEQNPGRWAAKRYNQERQ